MEGGATEENQAKLDADLLRDGARRGSCGPRPEQPREALSAARRAEHAHPQILERRRVRARIEIADHGVGQASSGAPPRRRPLASIEISGRNLPSALRGIAGTHT